MKTKSKSKTRAKRALPTKTVLEELERLRKTSGEIVARYLAEVEKEIAAVVDAVVSQSTAKKVPDDCAADFRDMLMLLRALEVKPAKGRRRDLKKIENTLEELTGITARW